MYDRTEKGLLRDRKWITRQAIEKSKNHIQVFPNIVKFKNDDHGLCFDHKEEHCAFDDPFNPYQGFD